MAPVECVLSKRVSDTSDQQVIYLKEKDGTRSFPILIGIFEVLAIHRTVNKETFARPLTHELIGRILESLNIEVERVVVSDLRDSTFYASLVLKQGEHSYDIDSRPSDAIAIAVQRGAPIFVEEAVLDKVARSE